MKELHKTPLAHRVRKPVPGSMIGRCALFPILLVGLAFGCGPDTQGDSDGTSHDLTGAWRSRVQFTSGDFAAIQDLEFMYVFNRGGTMTESSNYDAAPPVPPAYGIWREVGSGRFEARYEFYVTKAPDSLAALEQGGGWLPAGRGVLVEAITLAGDGRTFTSKIRYELYDVTGKPRAGGGEAEGRGERIAF